MLSWETNRGKEVWARGLLSQLNMSEGILSSPCLTWVSVIRGTQPEKLPLFILGLFLSIVAVPGAYEPLLLLLFGITERFEVD
jgi:hypothetical protein